jgi:hypothetical protein
MARRKVGGSFQDFLMRDCVLGEESMYEMNRHGALADRRRNPFNAAGSRVAYRKYPRYARFKQEWRTSERPTKVVVSHKIWSSDNKSLVVQDK